MICANVDEIEYLADLVNALSRDVDNTFYRIKDTAGSLQDSTQFQTYPKYVEACETINRASDEMNVLNERLAVLTEIIKNIPNEYKELEKKNIALINNAVGILGLINDGLDNSLQSTGVEVQLAEESVSNNDLQRMVENEYLRMQALDITPVSKKVQDEYEVKEVVPVVPVLSAEEVIVREEKEED